MARDWLEGAVYQSTLPSERAWALNNLGVAYERLGKGAEAARSFVEAAEAEPSDIPMANVAKVLLDRGEAEATIEWLQGAATWCAPGPSMKQALAVALMQSDRIEEATRTAQELVAGDGADKWAFALLGGLYSDSSQRYAEAVAILRQGLKRWPNDPVLWNNLSYALILANRLDEAESTLDELSRRPLTNKESAYVTATQGLLALYKGEISLGWKQYEKAIAIAGQESLRDRIKVKRDLEMGRALRRLGAKTSEIRAYLARAAGGPKSARPYTKHAERELRSLSDGSKSGE
jgi:Flp pilus assembly protein TadD